MVSGTLCIFNTYLLNYFDKEQIQCVQVSPWHFLTESNGKWYIAFLRENGSSTGSDDLGIFFISFVQYINLRRFNYRVYYLVLTKPTISR